MQREVVRQRCLDLIDGFLVDRGRDCVVNNALFWHDGKPKSTFMRFVEQTRHGHFSRSESMLGLNPEEEYLSVRKRVVDFFRNCLPKDTLKLFEDSTDNFEVVSFRRVIFKKGYRHLKEHDDMTSYYGSTNTVFWDDKRKGVLVFLNKTRLEQNAKKMHKKAERLALEVGKDQGYTEEEIDRSVDLRLKNDTVRVTIVHELLHHLIRVIWGDEYFNPLSQIPLEDEIEKIADEIVWGTGKVSSQEVEPDLRRFASG